VVKFKNNLKTNKDMNKIQVFNWFKIKKPMFKIVKELNDYTDYQDFVIKIFFVYFEIRIIKTIIKTRLQG
jgi:hypothetical protein